LQKSFWNSIKTTAVSFAFIEPPPLIMVDEMKRCPFE
jgi:hypothetical protein